MKSGKGKISLKTAILIIFLAVLCIGGAELLACRHFAPELYEEITAPVRESALSVKDALSRFGDRVSGLWNSYLQELEKTYSARPNITMVSQFATEPALSGSLSSDPNITQIQDENGHEVLTGGFYKTVFFDQGDEEWADKPFGTDNIGGYGCGPTAMAIVVASMTNTETDPALMSEWAADNGYWAKGSGSYHSIVIGTAEAYGLTAEALEDKTPEGVREALMSGKMLVALMGPGHFTNGGHFIVLRGVTASGEILVADPNSEERSLSPWDPQIILDELSYSNDSGAPLWVISQLPAPPDIIS